MLIFFAPLAFPAGNDAGGGILRYLRGSHESGRTTDGSTFPKAGMLKEAIRRATAAAAASASQPQPQERKKRRPSR